MNSKRSDLFAEGGRPPARAERGTKVRIGREPAIDESRSRRAKVRRSATEDAIEEAESYE